MQIIFENLVHNEHWIIEFLFNFAIHGFGKMLAHLVLQVTT